MCRLVDGSQRRPDAAADRVDEDRLHVLALLRLEGVAGDVGLQAAVAAQCDGEIDARAEQQDAEGYERDERRHAVADHGVGLGEFQTVHVMAQADGLAPFELFGIEDRVLYLPGTLVSGV